MSFTEAEKEMALDLYRAYGATRAAEETGCSRQSIYQWLADSLSTDNSDPSIKASQEAARTRVMREYARQRLLYAATRFIDRAVEPFSWVTNKGITVELDEPPGFEVDKLMRAANTALMLYRLEMGESTGRTETLTMGLIESEIQRLEARMVDQHDDADR